MTRVSSSGQAAEQLRWLQESSTRFTTAQRQLSTGKLYDNIQDMGQSFMPALQSRTALVELDSYKFNISTAQRRLTLMNHAIDQFKDQAQNVNDYLVKEKKEGNIDLNGVQRLAENAYNYMVDLLNVKDGERYLFAGGASDTKPIENKGLVDTEFTFQISEWIDGNISTDQLIENYGNTLDTTLEYSSVLSGGTAQKISVRVDEKTDLDYTVLANQDGFKEVLKVTGLMKNLSAQLDNVFYTEQKDADGNVLPPPAGTFAPGTTATEKKENFFKLWGDLSKRLNAGLEKLETISFDVAQVQVSIDTIEEDHTYLQNTYKNIIADNEDANIEQTAIELNQLRNSLEATYRVASIARGLSLVNFL
jgi:flagellar hook-associated protein 3 FlgL